MVHLPYFWSQKGRTEQLPDAASLSKHDQKWKTWLPTMTIAARSRIRRSIGTEATKRSEQQNAPGCEHLQMQASRCQTENAYSPAPESSTAEAIVQATLADSNQQMARTVLPLAEQAKLSHEDAREETVKNSKQWSASESNNSQTECQKDHARVSEADDEYQRLLAQYQDCSTQNVDDCSDGSSTAGRGPNAADMPSSAPDSKEDVAAMVRPSNNGELMDDQAVVGSDDLRSAGANLTSKQAVDMLSSAQDSGVRVDTTMKPPSRCEMMGDQKIAGSDGSGNAGVSLNIKSAAGTTSSAQDSGVDAANTVNPPNNAQLTGDEAIAGSDGSRIMVNSLTRELTADTPSPAQDSRMNVATMAKSPNDAELLVGQARKEVCGLPTPKGLVSLQELGLQDESEDEQSDIWSDFDDKDVEHAVDILFDVDADEGMPSAKADRGALASEDALAGRQQPFAKRLRLSSEHVDIELED